MPARVPQTIEELHQVILLNRGVSDAETFFHPPHPSKLTVEQTGLNEVAMTAVVNRLQQAAKNGEDVLIFGDYDADGICATAILWEAIHSIGARVRPFIPDRLQHGYGMTIAALDAICAEKKPDLIITVDNGIVAYPAVEEARRWGIFTIITDHHQADEKPLPADLLLHSTKLSGSGVSWYLAHALSPEVAARSLELAGLATIADQVPLLGANRSVAWHGLQALQKTTRVGLLELCKVAAVDQTAITERAVSFALAPRINAMGRIASAIDALRLLCTTSPARARGLAQLLQDTNLERQQLTQNFVDTAKEQVEAQKESPALVIYSTEFHEGVIGLIAGKLVEEYQKPVVVIAAGQTNGKGSARSTSAVNIVKSLRSVREHLLELGGHPMAAGFSIEMTKVEQFKSALCNHLIATATTTLAIEEVTYDCELLPHLLTVEAAESLESFTPFGAANPKPTFKITHAQLISSRLIGKKLNHRKFTFDIDGHLVNGIKWYDSSEPHPQHQTCSVFASLGIETWKKKSVQLEIVMINDMSPSYISRQGL